jgi:hypothetical protein
MITQDQKNTARELVSEKKEQRKETQITVAKSTETLSSLATRQNQCRTAFCNCRSLQ